MKGKTAERRRERRQKTAERRCERRQQVENERLARQAEREAARQRRGGRRLMSWKVRRGDSFSIDIDFRNSVIIEFDPEKDSVDDVPARVALQQYLTARSRNHDPN